MKGVLQYLNEMEMEKHKGHDCIDDYKIIKSIGSGYSAEVFLALDPYGRTVAIKKYRQEIISTDLLQDEIKVMVDLEHENILKVYDVLKNASHKGAKREDGNCFAIVLQYAEAGELFDYVAETGRFSQAVTRTYFLELLAGIGYMHHKGYAHRDIKLENLLLSEDYTLKIADFGFSCLLKGRDGSGMLKTKLGTEGYMAPEIASKLYQGKTADIFAAGVILFMMLAAAPPFENSSPNDPHYKLIREKKYETFWHSHSKKKPAGFFSTTFKELVQRMIAFNPKERPTLSEITKHEWVIEELACTHEQIIAEFSERQKKLAQILEEKRKQQEEERKRRKESIHNQGYANRDAQEGEDIQFIQFYNKQLLQERTLSLIEEPSADDIVIKSDKPAYVITQLKKFLTSHQISLQDCEQCEQIISEEQQQQDKLKVTALTDNGKQIEAVYECAFIVDEQSYTSRVSIVIQIGETPFKETVLRFSRREGDAFYFKKIVKDIRAGCFA